MARGNTYVCASCGQSFQFCPRCALVRPTYDAERFCCKSHADIFNILSKHGCGLATAEETIDALADYDLTGFTESIEKHIESLTETAEEVELPTQE